MTGLSVLAEANAGFQFRAAANACLQMITGALDDIVLGNDACVDTRSAVYRELIGKARGAEDLLEEAGFVRSNDGRFFILPQDTDLTRARELVAELQEDPTSYVQLRDQRRSHTMRTARLASLAAERQLRQERRALADAPSVQGCAKELLRNKGPALQVCVRTLKTIFTNILSSPKERKYRRIRLDKPKLQADVVSAEGGLDLMLAVGFVVMPTAQGEYVTCPMETPLYMLRAGLDSLKSIQDLKWSQEEHILVDQRELVGLSIAYELLYEMGDIDDPSCNSMREERMRAHIGWKDTIQAALPPPANTLADLHAVMATDATAPLTVEERMDLRRKKQTMIERYQ